MIEVPFTYAFTLGLVAAVNPCGFPMLPAYLSFFVGADDPDHADHADHASGAGGAGGGTDTPVRVLRALGAGACVSLGFFVVFLGFGLPIDAGLDVILDWVPWLTMVIGAGLAGLGVATLLGHPLRPGLPRLDRGGRTRGAGSMVLFGISYAVASLGCTLPLFLAVVAGTTSRENLASGVAAFGAYAAGMSVVLLALSLALAFAREGMVRWLRSTLRYVDRIAAVLLVAVGTYLVYYGVVAVRDDAVADSPVTFVDDLSNDLTVWIQDRATGLGLVLATMVAAGLAWSLLLRERR
ncbi:MAG: cytochrome c biogenesis CcdA family protein [Acidimicrobiia bacterium]